MPVFSVIVRAVTKAGSPDADYEDAAAADPEIGRFAVADGATESSFAGRWASLLVERFVAKDVPEPGARQLVHWLEEPADAWRHEHVGRTLPWYAQAKVAAGAFAALVGLVLTPRGDGGGRLRAVAVGDSCLFHLRSMSRELLLLNSFPVRRSADFGRTPRLVSTNPRANQRLAASFRSQRGSYRAGDVFVLATDALAHSLLRAQESGQPPWADLAEALTANAFAAWVDDLRAAGRLRNDDVTVLSITCNRPDACLSESRNRLC